MTDYVTREKARKVVVVSGSTGEESAFLVTGDINVDEWAGVAVSPLDDAPVPVTSVSGITASASFTPAAAAYLAGDLISVAQEFAFTFADGNAIPSASLIRILTTVVKIDQTGVISGETSYSLPLYDVTPPSAQADNAAWTLASADLAAYRGTLSLGVPADLGAACYIKTPLVDADIKLTGTSLFGQLITAGPFTATAVARQVFLYGIVL